MTRQAVGSALLAFLLPLAFVLSIGLLPARAKNVERAVPDEKPKSATPASRVNPHSIPPPYASPSTGERPTENPSAQEATSAAVSKPSGKATDIPTGIEYPIKVHVAVWVNSISKIDEVEGSFTAEVDVRLSWNDSRLGAELKSLGLDRQEFDFDEAPAKLATMWTPQLGIVNLDARSTAEDRVGLIIYARGAAEVLRRISAKFKSSLDFTRFPFDSQALVIEFSSPKYGSSLVVFAHEADDRHASGLKAGMEIPNWTFEPRIGVALATRRGWTGRDHSIAVARIFSHRETSQYFFQLFLPFFTIMLFPPLALWVPKADVTPRANMTFNGLFSLIGFSYAVFLRYPMLAAVDNVIVRMLYVAYIFLAAVLVLIMTVHNPHFTARFGAKHLWAEAASWSTWSAPLLFVLAIAGMILLSM